MRARLTTAICTIILYVPGSLFYFISAISSAVRKRTAVWASHRTSTPQGCIRGHVSTCTSEASRSPGGHEEPGYRWFQTYLPWSTCTTEGTNERDLEGKIRGSRCLPFAARNKTFQNNCAAHQAFLCRFVRTVL